MDIPYSTITKMIRGDKAAEDVNTNPATTDDPVAAKYDSIDSETNESVEHSKVNTKHEEKVQHVVDKERHQDHYHTTVQPLKAKEVLPEEHDFKTVATQEKSFDHDNARATQQKLDAEKAKFRDTATSSTDETKTVKATKQGSETVHHHLHETIQPVIEKEIIRPTTTHTTVPIHETHQDASVVHGTSTAAPMSVDEFKAAGNRVERDN